MDDVDEDDGPTDDDGDEPQRSGRPSKLTEKRIAIIVGALLDGNFKSVAARAAGVTPQTLNRWLKLGERFPGGLYGRLRAVCRVAEAEFERRAVAELRNAGKDDPKYLCWILERKYPERWGKARGDLVEVKRKLLELEKLIDATERDVDDLNAQGAEAP